MMQVRQLAIAALASMALLGRIAFPADAVVARAGPQDNPAHRIGLGDQLSIQVFDNADLDTTTYVAQDGSIRMPLAGSIKVAGSSPDEAARRIEAALKTGQFLLDPHVEVTLAELYHPLVTVIGEVASPGRYEIGPDQTVLDVIALAGGISEKGSDTLYILRTNAAGKSERLYVQLDLAQIASDRDSQPDIMQVLQAGDSIVVPKATFTITGQVSTPGEYRIESGMMLFQAIARAGGVTPLGSASRVEIARRGPDDKFVDIKGRRDTRIEPGDVIKVKERIF
jgi:polysaccharide biosynthesis/export protein